MRRALLRMLLHFKSLSNLSIRHGDWIVEEASLLSRCIILNGCLDSHWEMTQLFERYSITNHK